MGAGKTLMLVAEILAVTAVAVQFLLPGEVGISLHIGHKVLGLPIRWVRAPAAYFPCRRIEYGRSLCPILAAGARLDSSSRSMSAIARYQHL